MSQYVTAPPETDTVHSGLLYYKNKGKFSSSYSFYAAYLLHESTRGAKRIELHSENTASPYATVAHVVICLEPPVSYNLSTAKKSKSMPPHKLVVTTGTGKHVFRLNSKDESRKWADMLDRTANGPPLEGHTYEFPVKILSTKHAEVLQLNGCYILKVTDTHALLYSSNGALPTKFQCPIEDIAKVHCSQDTCKQSILIINTSSTSPVGEGGFAFIAQDAGTISNVISYRHDLLEPPLPPRNKTPLSALKEEEKSSRRQLTSSHSFDDILKTDSHGRTSNSSISSPHLPRTPSVDMLGMPPLPPPRPRTSLPPDENMAAASTNRSTLNQSPQNGLDHSIFKWPGNSHNRAVRRDPEMSRRSLDQGIPPPLPHSPRPRTSPRHAHSLDTSSCSPESSPKPSHRASVDCKSPSVKQSLHSDQARGSKKTSIPSPPHNLLSGASTLGQTKGDQVISNGSTHHPARRITNISDLSFDGSHRVASETSAPDHLSGVDAHCEELRAEADENDFETVDNWIKDKPSPSSISTTITTTSLSQPPTILSQTAPVSPQDEPYDYMRRAELKVCMAQATDSYLKLIA